MFDVCQTWAFNPYTMRVLLFISLLLCSQSVYSQIIDSSCLLINSINWWKPSPFDICTGDTIRFRARGRAPSGINLPYTCCYQMVWWEDDVLDIIDTFNLVQAYARFTKPGSYYNVGDCQQGIGLLYNDIHGNSLCCSIIIYANVYDCPPTIKLKNPPLRICVGDSVRYIAQARHMPTDWHWVFDGANINSADSIVPPFVRYDVPGTYAVKLHASNTAGADSLVHTIEVLPRPTRLYDIELDEQYTLRPNDTLRLHTAYQSDYYNWQPNVTNLACLNCANPLFTATTEGFYPFVCTAGVGECSENNYIGVTVKDDIRYFAPTAFTPNGDGLNELFEIKGYDIDIKSIKIFDRWGNLVYYGEGNTAAWDGANHLSGNYVWLMECTDRYNNQPKTRKGSVMLLR